MQPLGRQKLVALQRRGARNLVQPFLNGAEGAGPATKQAAPEQKDGHEDEDPVEEQERIAQEQIPLPLEQQRVQPGQHLRDRRLRHQAKAHPEDEDGPEGELEGIDRPLVFVRGAAREMVAQGIYHRDGHQQQRKQHDLRRALLPHFHPRGFGHSDLGMAAHQILLRQPVALVKHREHALARGRIALVAQKDQLPRIRRRKGRRTHNEDAGFAELGRAFGLEGVQVHGIAVLEGEDVVVLPHLHAVINAAAHEARTFERFGSRRANDEDGVLPFLHAPHQVFPGVFAQQRRTDDGRIERAEPQLNERHVAFFKPHLLWLDHQLAYCALFDQRVPIRQGLASGRLHIAHWLTHQRLDDAHLPRHGRAGSGDDLVLRDNRHRSAGNGINAQHAFIGPGLAHFNLVLDGFADVLGIEIKQRRLRDAQQQDGFGVLDDFDANVFALRVHADQRDYRLARIGGRVGDVGREHHVAELLLAIFAAVGFHVGWLAHAFGKRGCPRKHVLARQQGAHVLGRGQPRRQGRFVGLRAACALTGGLHRQRRQ